MTSKKKNDPFSYWHLQVMRSRLNAYKLNESCRGWINVAENIIFSDSNDFNFPEESEDYELKLDNEYRDDRESSPKSIKEDSLWPIQAQLLGRFVDGRNDKKTGERKFTNPSLEIKIAIFNFLVEKGYLSPRFSEIDKSEIAYNVAYSLCEYFTSSNYERLPSFMKYDMNGEYGYEVKDSKFTHCHLLIMVPSENREFQLSFFLNNIQK